MYEVCVSCFEIIFQYIICEELTFQLLQCICVKSVHKSKLIYNLYNLIILYCVKQSNWEDRML